MLYLHANIGTQLIFGFKENDCRLNSRKKT